MKYNGIYVRCPLFDPILPWRRRPNYESGIITSVNEHLKKGEKVVIVGGGNGVTAVVVAEQIGEDGNVIVYEGSADKVERCKQTARLNGVSDRIEVRHGIVGPSISVWGEEKGAPHLEPKEIPDCDVLELDCEGAETDILENIQIRPRVIIVESHGVFDAPTEEVKRFLEDLSYTVVSEDIAEISNKETCLENDIYVLTGVREVSR
jgi:tRNA A58 N-methylase Trm61